MAMLGACVQGSAPRGQISVNDGKIKRGSERHASTSPPTHTHTQTRAQCQPRGPRKQLVAVPRCAAPCRADAGDFGCELWPWAIFGSRAGGLGGAGATPDFDGNCWVTRRGAQPPPLQVGIASASGRAIEGGRSGCRSIILIRSLLPTLMEDQLRRPVLRHSTGRTTKEQGTVFRAKVHTHTCRARLLHMQVSTCNKPGALECCHRMNRYASSARVALCVLA